MKRRSLLVTSAIALLVAQGARADEDPRKTQAEALFSEGLKLHDRDREAEALEKFRKAYAAFPTPNALYWVAREEQLVGETLAALRHYREATSSPLLYEKNMQFARRFIAELEVRFGRVTVLGPAGTTITIAGRELRLPMDSALDVEPGTVIVRGERDRVTYQASGLAVAGKALSLELTPAGPGTTTATPAATGGGGPEPVLPPQEAEQGFWTTGHTVGVVLGVGALGALGAGVGFRLAAGGKGDDADRLSRDPAAAPGCVGESSATCSELDTAAKTERDYKNTSTGLLVGGAALGVAAAAAFVFWPSPSRARSTANTFFLSPTLGGLMARGQF